jgi:large subunit ribosomal protein L10
MPSAVKEIMMKEIDQEFEKSSCAFISSFESLSVADLSEFRRTIEKVATRSILVKHAMAKKVFAKHNVPDAEKFLKGQIVVTFGTSEPQRISKALVDFAKANQKLVPSGMVLDNRVYDQAFVKQLANLPSRQELITQVVVRVQSPISGFVMTLNQVLRGFVVALNEIKKQKESGSAA